MKRISEFVDSCIYSAALPELTAILRDNDADFPQLERRFHAAVKALDASQGLELFQKACEQDILARMLFAGYLGFMLNLENFHHPAGVGLPRADTIDYLKGHLIGTFPVSERAEAVRSAFYKQLSDDLYTDISDYYIALECAGSKLAHYAGYMLANELLPWMEPGYRADPFLTGQLAALLRNALGFVPE